MHLRLGKHLGAISKCVIFMYLCLSSFSLRGVLEERMKIFVSLSLLSIIQCLDGSQCCTRISWLDKRDLSNIVVGKKCVLLHKNGLAAEISSAGQMCMRDSTENVNL